MRCGRYGAERLGFGVVLQAVALFNCRPLTLEPSRESREGRKRRLFPDRRLAGLIFGLAALAMAAVPIAQAGPNDAADCGIGNPLHGRTQAVVDAIVVAMPRVTDCADVTDKDLAEFNGGSRGFPGYLQVGVNYDDSLAQLRVGDFAGLSSLQWLSLSINQLTSLPTGIFNGLSNLRVLSLVATQITSLPAGTFTGLSNLEYLSLDGSPLTSLPTGTFDGLSNLRQLHLDDSRLTSLPAGIFNGLSNLEALALNNSQLASLPGGIFNGLSNLRDLLLYSNNLTSLPAGIFSGLTNLQELSLDDNRLTGLPAGMLSGLSSLRTLYLFGNQLGNVPSSYFRGQGLGALAGLYLGEVEFNSWHSWTGRRGGISVIDRLATIDELASYQAVLPSLSTLVMVDGPPAKGIVLSSTVATVAEAGGTSSYTVALSSVPSNSVTVRLSSADAGVATVSPQTLTFTSSNWSAPKTVTVTGVDDATVNAPARTTVIRHTVSGGGYDGVIVSDVHVTLIDDDEASESAPSPHNLPLFLSASSVGPESFARIINHSDASGTVRITGIDDVGREHGPVELKLEAWAAANLTSRDLEDGNAGKGLSGRLGDGEGNWRLRLESEFALEVLSYIRTKDGFVTAMHERVPTEGLQHRVRLFNSGRNRSQVSRLRLINPTAEEVEVIIEGRDDAGNPAPGSEVRLTLDAGESREVSAQALESGGDGLIGSLGEGTGKWQLFVTADAGIEVMSLLRDPTGHLSNLSAPGLRNLSAGRELELPLFLPASHSGREGVARVINHSERAGTVRIYGIDDSGEWAGPVTFALAAGAVAHFNSQDLEGGNPAKGLTGALGSGSGSWRLRLHSELDVEALAFVRTSDGFVTPMHGRVRESAMRHHVAFFNPANNTSQVSSLRLINPNEDQVEVIIEGRDDSGEAAPGGEVSLTLAPETARTLTAKALEFGEDGVVGSFGDGTGKWQLFVTADSTIEAMNLLTNPTGHLANLSASGVESVVSEGGLDQPVALRIIVTVPPAVTSLRAADMTTTVLGSRSAGVTPGGAPSLLMASDADGAVLYALVNEDGGFLGEERGTVRVSVASTAVVLMALAAGYRVPSVTAEAVATILSHPEFGVLVRTLVRLLNADKNFVTRLSEYPDVVTVIQRMVESLTGADGASLARSEFAASDVSIARAKHSVFNTRSALPDGIFKPDFYCTPLTRWPCSPWDPHEPWRWFGEASAVDLTEAERPPFLARSEAAGSRAVHAAATPGFVGYAMELYAASGYRGFVYVPGNASVLAKLRNSGAAYREVLAGEGRLLGPHIERIRFERYLFSARADGTVLSDRALVASFFNTAQLMISIANLVLDFSTLGSWLVAIVADESKYRDVAACARTVDALSGGGVDPNASLGVQGLTIFRHTARGFFRALSTGACRSLLAGFGPEQFAHLMAAQTLDAVLGALTGVGPLLALANETGPRMVSYLAPSAARSEYYLKWDETPGGQAYIAQVSQRPVPVAAFGYAQRRGFLVELDASSSEGEGLRYEWRVAGRRIGTGRVLEHNFRAADTFQVTLAVTDRNGMTVEERGSVPVTAGRVPEVRVLTCTATGVGTAFTMQAELSDADNDIETVEWFSSISNPRPDQVTGAGETRVTLSAPDGASHTRAKVRIVDGRGNKAERNCPVVFDPTPPTPRVSGASTEEGNSLFFTVSLDRAPAETVTYYYATYRATARSEDYTGHYATALRFSPREMSKTIMVRSTEDTRIEGDETFYVYLTDALSKHPAPDRGLPTDYLARATGTIRDDDTASTPAPSISNARAEEGDSLTFTVALDQAPSSSVTFYYATYATGTAAGGNVDYYGRRATALTFGAGQISRTITIGTVEDTEDESNETFYVYLTDAASKHPYSGVPSDYLARATGTIRDDDTASIPTPSISNASAEEGDSLIFTVTLDQAPSSSVTFYYATYATGTATGGSVDYYGRRATALTFGAGQISRTITIGTVEDTEDESDETFYVYLTDAASKHPYSGVPSDYLARATGTIRDDDTASTPAPSISNARAEEGDSLTFTVALDQAPSSSVTFYYATYATGTATGGNVDYYGRRATALTFGAGQISRTITIGTVEDTEDESDETFYIYLTDAASKHPFSGVPSDYLARATGTIRDDDTASTPTPSISNASAEEGDSLIFTVTLDQAPSSSVTFYYATYATGTATGGSVDYYGRRAAALTFGAGQVSRTITIGTVEDTEDESDETFYVYLTDASSKHPNSGVPTDYLDRATGTIRDDDTASTPTPSIANAGAEEGASITFTVTLNRTPSSSVTYYYATYRGTARSGDYTGHYATALTFSTSQTSRTITVSTTEDTEDEDDETFYVYLTDAASKHPYSGVPSDYLARATGTIRDDDTATTPAPSISDASAEEGESLSFAVTLDRTPASAVTFYYATYRGSAGSEDYTGHYATALTFSAGQTSRTIRVYTNEDTEVENDEGFSVYLTDAASKHPTDGTPSDYLASATGTIRDDDSASTPTPSISNASAEEGETLSFAVTLDRSPTGSVTYYYATYQSTARGGGTDYTGHYATALTFSSGQTSRTITVDTTEDTEDESDEMFYVYLTDASSKHPSSGVPSDYLDRATGTIRDDDTATAPTPSISNASAEEGETLSFAVTLDRSPAGSVTYYYATYQSTARGGGTDYTGHYATALTFSSGQTSRTITVDTTEDTEVEDDETFYVYLTDASSKHPSSGVPSDYLDRATGTIHDDDTPAAKPDLIVSSASLSDSTVEQGDRVRVDATVKNQGSGRAGGSRVAYYISKVGTSTLTKVDDDSVNSLNPGSSDSEYDYIDTDDLEVGTYLVLIKADYDNRVAESDENNNVSSGVNFRFTVTAPALPDLVVSSASLGDTTVEQGDRIRISATVMNQGSGSAGRSRVAYYWGNSVSNLTRVGDDSVSSLSAGESDDEYINADTDDLTPGIYFVLISADYEKDVDESDETNNIYSNINFRFTVTAP